MTHPVTLEVDDEVLLATGQSPAQFLNALPQVSVAVSNLGPDDLEHDIAFAKHG